MICNSSYLADWKKVATPSDVVVLAELGHRDKIRIVERLSEGPARQRDLIDELGLTSGTLSKWLAELVGARLVVQEGSAPRDPYWLVKPDTTNALLDIAAQLASELADAEVERAQEQATVDRQRLQERRKRPS
jgi:DNA-binding HxlR family transcriptional regulator